MKKIYLKLTVLLLTLIVGVGQMWADNAGLKNCYLRYDKNGSETTVTTSEGTTTGTETTLNEVTSLAIKGIWINNWTNSGTGISGNQVCYMIWSTHDGDGAWQYQQTDVQGTYSGNTRQDSWTGTINVVTSSTPSDEYYLNYYFESWYSGGEGNHYLPGNSGKSKLHYKVLPPNPSSISVSASSGSIGGSGTENSPYLVRYNGSLSLSTSGTRSFDDPNSSLYVKYGGDSYSSTTTKTISSITSTDAQYIDVEIKYYNSSASLSSATPRTQRVYYKVATYAITLDDNGDYVENGSATAAYMRTTLTGITAPRRTGYHVDGYYGEAGTTTHISDASGNLQASKTVSTTPYTDKDSQWLKQSATTLYTKWAANTYDVTLKANTGTGDDQVVQASYDADMPTTLKGSSDAVTVHTKTGYNLLGYWDATSDGNQYYSYNVGTSTLSSYRTWNMTSNTDLYAHWNAKTYTITIDVDEANKGTTTGATGSVTATYDATMPSISGSLPTGANGYRYMGLYTDQGGEGVALTDSLNGWKSDVDGYISSGKWVHDGAITVYAYYKKAEVTRLTLSAGVVEPRASITVTPTLYPTPQGTVEICWEILYSNDTPLPSQPTFSLTGENPHEVSFTAPDASATYQVQASLYLDDGVVEGCSGTLLHVYKTSFQVAGTHTVTIRYQDENGNTLKASGTIEEVHPLVFTDDPITAPNDIIGYKFDHWEAGDGVTLSENGEDDLGSDESEEEDIYIKATYDGTLTAVYEKKRMIYFNNTLEWSAVYVYFYSNDKYWGYGSDEGKGTGSNPSWTKDATTPFIKSGAMIQIGETNIWYYDCEANSVSSDVINVAFTELHQTSVNYFGKTGDDKNKVARRGDFKYASLPMFVPLTNVDPVAMNNNEAEYYNEGYWMNYPENTGYVLHIYSGTTYGKSDQLQEIPFEFTADKTLPMSVNVGLNAKTTYGFEIHRADGTVLAEDSYTLQSGNSGDEGQTVRTIGETTTERSKITTTVAGDYTFKLNFGNSGGYKYLIGVHYPVATGDYRILYTDDATWSNGAHTANYSWWHESRTIHKENGATDIVSFYVKVDEDTKMKFQYASSINPSTGAVTWADVASGDISLGSITKDGVYNFYLTQANGGISVSKIEPYIGHYYIRTDCAGSTKWESFRTTDHQMTYSEYAKDNKGFTHYYVHWVENGKNVKFTIANDYSLCISDTLAGDTYTDASEYLPAGANIRFMWDSTTNKISRAYISGSSVITDRFLVLEGDAKMYNESGDALTGENRDHDNATPTPNYLNANEVILHDDQNFVYERSIKVKTGAQAKLTALYNGKVQYFIGTESTTELLLGGTASETKHKMRVVYDFKTDRLVKAYIPEGEIDDEIAIHADIMLVREHQGAGQQLTFSNDAKAKLTNVQTVYGVMRFNRWTLNNKKTTGAHGIVDDPKSAYERGLYWISFPFDVNLSDVFGFGTYGVDWIIEEYNGAKRAQEGYWADSEGFWEYVMNRNGKVLEAGKGYVLALDLDRMHDDNTSFWSNNIEQVELFFPSANAVQNISKTTAHVEVPEHECTIGPRFANGDDRTKKDSHWNIIGVPSYANYGTELKNSDDEEEEEGEYTITWNDDPATDDVPFLYEWNSVDNSYSVQSGTTYPFKSMHAYMVQYHGDIYWNLASVGYPSSVAARLTETPDVEYMLSLIKDEAEEDHTYVRMTDKEGVTIGFEFKDDLCKEYNSGRANIWTVTADTVQVAGNSQPHPLTTTIVPVGVKIAANGEYTFSMPEGTNGGDVWLIDNANSSRTNLGLMDYTVNLTIGTYEGRFSLEFPVQNVVTEIENAANANANANAEARKVFVGGRLYILRDGKAYDATGAQVR